MTGGMLGCFAFLWIARQGFYALVLPGGLTGLGGGLLVTDRSVLRGALCGLLALGAGLLGEWKLAPFIADAGLGYFLVHVHELRPMTLLMIGLGGVLGYWLSVGKAGATESDSGNKAL